MMNPITVILADNNRHIHESFKMLIYPLKDIRVAGEAHSGEEAISIANELRPDVMLMDINMSPVNGLEATKQILDKNPDIKIIGLSMHSDISFCKSMMSLGAYGYLTKASTYREIIDAIKEVAVGKKYIDKKIAAVI